MAILLPRRSPNSSECGPRLSHGGPAFRCFGLKPDFRKPTRHCSTTSNLLFGCSLALISQPPVHSFAGAGLNSRTGDTLQQEGDGRRPRVWCRKRGSRECREWFSLNSYWDFCCSIASSASRMRCQSRTAKRRIRATRAIFFFFGFFATSLWYTCRACGS